MSRILIAGDTLPTEANTILFSEERLEEIFDQSLITFFQNCAISIANLEGPLTKNTTPIPKSGPNLKAEPSCISTLKRLGITALSLSNNHIMDFGSSGLYDTIQTLEAKKIACFGAGNNLPAAKKPYIFTLDSKKVGVLACAEHEFTIAGDHLPGVNPFDPLETLDDIAALKEQTDYVIVLYHGGKEYYRYPAPYLQKRCRKMVDKGANLILCQHSHCVGSMEVYKASTILYGQGNFIFSRGGNEFCNYGLLVEIDLKKEEILFHPVMQTKCGGRLADAKEKKTILNDFYMRSEQIKEAGFIEKEYQKFAHKMLPVYDRASLGLFFKIVKLHPKLYRLYFRRKDRLKMLNTLRCEAHWDLYREGLLDWLKIENHANP
ncbi:MAG: CapA family protein [Lachnospiraceae bacterium]|nr:CapA family protein [Lachnospiraceae bacterium]